MPNKPLQWKLLSHKAKKNMKLQLKPNKLPFLKSKPLSELLTKLRKPKELLLRKDRSLNTRNSWLREELDSRRDSNTFGLLAQLDAPNSMWLSTISRKHKAWSPICLPRPLSLMLSRTISRSIETLLLTQLLIFLKWPTDKIFTESLVLLVTIESLNSLKKLLPTVSMIQKFHSISSSPFFQPVVPTTSTGSSSRRWRRTQSWPSTMKTQKLKSRDWTTKLVQFNKSKTWLPSNLNMYEHDQTQWSILKLRESNKIHEMAKIKHICHGFVCLR